MLCTKVKKHYDYIWTDTRYKLDILKVVKFMFQSLQKNFDEAEPTRLAAPSLSLSTGLTVLLASRSTTKGRQLVCSDTMPKTYRAKGSGKIFAASIT